MNRVDEDWRIAEGFRYGSSFVDATSGIRFTGYHPVLFPEAWTAYLDGADEVYKSRGIDGSLERRALESGAGVSMFFLGRNEVGEAVAGIRFHGPFEKVSEASLLVEMRDSPEFEDIRSTLEGAIPEGLIEMKGMWSLGSSTNGASLVKALVRPSLLASGALGVRYVCNTVADRLTHIGHFTGITKVWADAVEYPDSRYKTVAMLFDAEVTKDNADPGYWAEHEADVAHVTSEVHSEAGVASEAHRGLVLGRSRLDQAVASIIRRRAGQILDTYDTQLAQLREVKGIGPSVVEEGKYWVFYAWTNTLVATLGPRGFAAVRLERNRNKITRGEQEKLRTMKIGVVGASAGHAIAHALVQEGLCGEIRLADFDEIELSNLNRIPARVADLGINKAVVLARRVSEIDPYVRIEVLRAGVSVDNVREFLRGLNVVVEECDDLGVKALVREEARRLRIPVIMETSDRGLLDVERFDIEPERPIFHGRLGKIGSKELAGLSLAERGPYVVALIGADEASARGVSSLLELGVSLTGWPQLGSEVVLGAASVAAAVRDLFTSGDLASGRVRVDLESCIGALSEPTPAAVAAWDSAPEDPETQSTDVIVQLVDAARRAPSGGNAQPWRYEASDTELRFYSDLARSGSSMDIQGRGSVTAIGAGVFNARVRAAALGVLGEVSLVPEGEYSTHLATLTLGGGSEYEITPLNRFLASRNTNRRVGVREELSPRVIETLARAGTREGARVRIVHESAALGEIAAMLGAADQQRFLLKNVHTEMMSELRWPGRDSLVDGLDVRTLELGAGVGLIGLLRRRDVMDELSAVGAGAMLGMQTRNAVASGSGVAVITVTRSGVAGYLRGGAAMERLWLVAESLGIRVQPVSPLYLYADSEADLLRLGGERNVDALASAQRTFKEFFDISGSEVMVMVLRLFSGEAASVHSIRRPIEDVLTRI